MYRPPFIDRAEVEKIALQILDRKLNTPRPTTIATKVGSTERDIIGGALRPYYELINRKGVTTTTFNDSGTLLVLSGPMRLFLPTGSSLNEFLLSARIAVQGNTGKAAPAPAVVGALDTVITLTGTTMFGALVRVANSPTLSNYQPVQINLNYGPGLASLLSFTITPMKNVIDILTLFPSDSAGLGLIQGVSNATITIPAGRGQVGSVLSAESLNQRDL